MAKRPAAAARGAAVRGLAGRDTGPDSIADRGIAALPYILPLLDGLRYGRFFFKEFPMVLKLILPLRPLIEWYSSFPFASLLVFFGLYYGLVNNQNFSYYVRFNCMQCILLDILLMCAPLPRRPLGAPRSD